MTNIPVSFRRTTILCELFLMALLFTVVRIFEVHFTDLRCHFLWSLVRTKTASSSFVIIVFHRNIFNALAHNITRTFINFLILLIEFIKTNRNILSLTVTLTLTRHTWRWSNYCGLKFFWTMYIVDEWNIHWEITTSEESIN